MDSVLSSLNSMSSEIQIPKFHLICAKFKDERIAGLSRLDRIITPEPFVCMGPVNLKMAKGYSYCHNDDRAQYDACRHEIGHILTTKDVLAEYLSITEKMIGRYGRPAFDKYVMTAISQYAYEYGPKEEIAELFSIITDDDGSQRRKIVPELVHFVESNMICSGKVNKSTASVSTDEWSEMKRVKFYIPSVIIDNFATPPSPELKWDTENGKWVKKSEWAKRMKRGEFVVLDIPEHTEWAPSKELELAMKNTSVKSYSEDVQEGRYESM